VAEVALENATNAIDERIALVTSIMEDALLPEITGGGTGKYKSTVQSFNWFDDGPNLADLQGQIDRLSSEGMFIRMQELRAASPTGSTGLAAQSDAEGRALRESFAQLNQAQSPAKFKQELGRISAQLNRTKTGLTNSFAAEFAPIRGGAAAPPAAPDVAAGGALSAPRVGEVVDGYTFKGGDPSKQENWSK
jgi:hypothetical protein